MKHPKKFPSSIVKFLLSEHLCYSGLRIGHLDKSRQYLGIQLVQVQFPFCFTQC